eukprot:5171648-Prymnesium_polylepis.1
MPRGWSEEDLAESASPTKRPRTRASFFADGLQEGAPTAKSPRAKNPKRSSEAKSFGFERFGLCLAPKGPKASALFERETYRPDEAGDAPHGQSSSATVGLIDRGGAAAIGGAGGPVGQAEKGEGEELELELELEHQQEHHQEQEDAQEDEQEDEQDNIVEGGADAMDVAAAAQGAIAPAAASRPRYRRSPFAPSPPLAVPSSLQLPDDDEPADQIAGRIAGRIAGPAAVGISTLTPLLAGLR